MTEDDLTGHSSAATDDRVAALLEPPLRRQRRRGLFRREKRYNRRIRWLRLLALLAPLCFLALISIAFGAVLAVEPQIAPLVASLKAHYTKGANSTLWSAPDPGVQQIATLTNHNQFFLAPADVPLDSLIAHAVIAIEDKRFLSEPAIDYRGVARALVSDAFGGGGTQGGSTITEQFVKTALGQGEPNDRTIVEKVREAFTAFQLTHLWSKQEILTEYLNTANFGVATGVEAAAQAWFGNDPNSNLSGCGRSANVKDVESLCVTNLNADEAALLAGIIDSPNTYVEQLTTDPQLVFDRRNEVLKDMWQQGFLTEPEYLVDTQVSLPSPLYVESPSEEDTNPITGYFASWVAAQLSSNPKFANKVDGGGLRVYTTLDLKLETAAKNAVEHYLPPYSGPSAALVAIDNSSGDVKAMFGGYNFNTHAFNLATQAERQPGSAWKVFDLAVALQAGYGPNYLVKSGPFPFPAQPPYYPAFTFHNDEGGYANAKIPLSEALAVSDNTVFARLSLDTEGTGVAKIAALAKQWGISTGISLNPSMVIGGLTEGVTPLDMAHAYETLAQDGLVTGTLASQECAGGIQGFTQENAPKPGSLGCPGPSGIRFVAQGTGNTAKSPFSWHNQTSTLPIDLSPREDKTEIEMMHGPLSSIGTAADAFIPGVSAWGKTGTTSNYTDAWFCGSTPNLNTNDGRVPSMTVCVWVGYPESAKSMSKNFGGKPVYGGTYPALIWRNYVVNAIQTIELENAAVHQAALARQHHSTPAGSSGASGTTGLGSPESGANVNTTPPAAGATDTGGTAATTITPPTGTTSPGTTAPATNTNTNTPTGTTSPGNTAPTTNEPPTGTVAPTTTPATTTPASPPPATSQGGGITAPGGGAIGPTG